MSAQLVAMVDDAIKVHEKAVADARAGRGYGVGFLVGQVMKASGGYANVEAVQRTVIKRLGIMPAKPKG